MYKGGLLLLCACAIWSASADEGTKGGDATLRAIALSNHNFTSALYSKLSQAEGNIFFSPLSIQMILSLAAMGATGPTSVQMKRGLSLLADNEVTKIGFQKLTASLKRNDAMILKIANKVFTDTQLHLKTEFVTTAQKYFNADAATVNFKQDAEGARNEINHWVEDQTENKIKELFSEGSLTSDTEMVLANAVYFKANWASPFNRSETQTKPFHVSEGVTENVPMMHITGEFFYKQCKELDAQVLELPYVDYKLSMVIILPNKRDGLADVEMRLKTTPMSTVTKHLRLPEVIVWLPKFKMEQTYELNDVLKEMGMTNMFSNAANFSGITDNEVYVDKVAHKAFIEVNEEGAEAAGATGVSFQSRMGGRTWEPLEFRADHPFIFVLRHKYKSNPVLFMGRYSNP